MATLVNSNAAVPVETVVSSCSLQGQAKIGSCFFCFHVLRSCSAVKRSINQAKHHSHMDSKKLLKKQKAFLTFVCAACSASIV